MNLMISINYSQLNQKQHYNRNNRNKNLRDLSNNNSAGVMPLLTLHQVKGIYFRGGQNPEVQNKKLSELFEECYKTGEMTNFIRHINKELPALTGHSECTKIPSIELNNKGQIQITHPDLGDIFYTGSDITGDSIRGLDPAPQKDWTRTPLKSEWPPSKNQEVIQAKDRNTNAVLFETNENPDYKTRVKGMVSVNPEDASVICVYQQENNHPDIEWAAWTIAPFKVPEGKKAIGVFPASKGFCEKNKDKLEGTGQWEFDEKSCMVMVKPNENGGFCDPFDSETSWGAFAIEGSDKVMVIRSIYKEPFEDKFKACVVEDNARFTEIEFMAPKVSRGKKSTIACRIDFIPLSELGVETFEKERMEGQMKQVSGKLAEIIRN